MDPLTRKILTVMFELAALELLLWVAALIVLLVVMWRKGWSF